MAIPEEAFAGAIATALVLTTFSCAAAELKNTAKTIAATNAKRKVGIILFAGTEVAFLTVDLDLNTKMGHFSGQESTQYLTIYGLADDTTVTCITQEVLLLLV